MNDTACPWCGRIGRPWAIARHAQACVTTVERLIVVLKLYEYTNVGDPDQCWLPPDEIWRGKVSGRRAHQTAFIVAYGPVPPGKEVCHTCDVSGCANPAHLWAGTHRENMDDMVAKDRPRGRPGTLIYRDVACPTCGKVTSRHDKQQDWCSRQCYLASLKGKPQGLRVRVYRDAVCPTCGVTSRRNDRQKDYCSRTCYMNRRDKR